MVFECLCDSDGYSATYCDIMNDSYAFLCSRLSIFFYSCSRCPCVAIAHVYLFFLFPVIVIRVLPFSVNELMTSLTQSSWALHSRVAHLCSVLTFDVFGLFSVFFNNKMALLGRGEILE